MKLTWRSENVDSTSTSLETKFPTSSHFQHSLHSSKLSLNGSTFQSCRIWDTAALDLMQQEVQTTRCLPFCLFVAGIQSSAACCSTVKKGRLLLECTRWQSELRIIEALLRNNEAWKVWESRILRISRIPRQWRQTSFPAWYTKCLETMIFSALTGC